MLKKKGLVLTTCLILVVVNLSKSQCAFGAPISQPEHWVADNDGTILSRQLSRLNANLTASESEQLPLSPALIDETPSQQLNTLNRNANLSGDNNAVDDSQRTQLSYSPTIYPDSDPLLVVNLSRTDPQVGNYESSIDSQITRMDSEATVLDEDIPNEIVSSNNFPTGHDDEQANPVAEGIRSNDSQVTRMNTEATVLDDESTASREFPFAQRDNYEESFGECAQRVSFTYFSDRSVLSFSPEFLTPLPQFSETSSVDKLKVYTVDLRHDPVLAARVNRRIISGNSLPISGIVGKISDDAYFTFPFVENSDDSDMETGLSLESSPVLTPFVPDENYVFTTPEKKRNFDQLTCPPTPILKRRAPFDPNQYFKDKIEPVIGVPASSLSSALCHYLSDLNRILKVVGHREVSDWTLIAFEYYFDDVFMAALQMDSSRLLLPGMLIGLIREEDFDKFNAIRAEFKMSSSDSRDFARTFLQAALLLPTISNRALQFLTSSVNAPFLFNHTCYGNTGLYVGKFCIEHAITALKYIDNLKSNSGENPSHENSHLMPSLSVRRRIDMDFDDDDDDDDEAIGTQPQCSTRSESSRPRNYTTDDTQHNPLATWLFERIKIPFRLENKSSVGMSRDIACVATAFLKDMDICFSCHEDYLNFIRILFKTLLSNKSLKSSFLCQVIGTTIEMNLLVPLLKLLLQNKDLDEVKYLYSIVRAEDSKPVISKLPRHVTLIDLEESPFYVLKVNESQHSISDLKTVVLQKL